MQGMQGMQDGARVEQESAAGMQDGARVCRNRELQDAVGSGSSFLRMLDLVEILEGASPTFDQLPQ